MNDTISFEDFKKMVIKIGEIVSAEKIEDTDKLLKLKVDFNEGEPRVIVSGIALRVNDPQELVGRKFPFVTNLETRIIRGVESQGMIMAVVDDEEKFSFLEPSSPIKTGSRVS
jgi:methionine--tRNA ligase beta chain